MSELATDFRGLSHSLQHQRERTAALRVEQVRGCMRVCVCAVCVYLCAFVVRVC